MPRQLHLKSFLCVALAIVITQISTLSTLASPHHSPVINSSNYKGLNIVGVAARGMAYRAGWSPDGKHFAVASASGLWLYDANFNSESSPVSGYLPVIDMGFSGDSKTIAWLSYKTSVGFWDIAHHRDLVPSQFVWSGPEEERMLGMRLNAGGNLLLTQSTGNPAIFWNMETGQQIEGGWRIDRQLDISQPSQVAFSPDGSMEAEPYDQGVLVGLVSRLNDQNYATDGIDTPSPATSVTFSPDNRVVAVGEQNGQIILWSVETKQFVATWKADVGSVTSVVFNPTGDLLLVVGENGSLELWNVSQHKSLNVIKGTGNVSSIAFNSDGSAYILTRDSSVEVYKTLTGQIMTTIADASRPAFSPDGRAFTAISDGGVSIWDTLTGKLERSALGYNGDFSQIAYSRDGKLLGLAGRDGIVWVRSAFTGDDIATFQGSTTQVNDVVFTPTADAIYSGGNDGAVRRWNLKTGATTVLGQVKGRVLTLSLDTSGTQLAVASDDGLDVWNMLSSTRRTLTTTAHIAATFRPNSNQLAALTDTGVVQLWTTDPDKIEAYWQGFAPDTTTDPIDNIGETVATDDYDGNLDRGLLVFSSDGNWLLSSGDGTRFRYTQLHNMITGQDSDGPDGFQYDVLSAAFSSGSDLLFSVFNNDYNEGEMSLNFMRATSIDSTDDAGYFSVPDTIWVQTVVFSPDGAHIAMLTGGGAVWIWAVEPQQEVF